MNNNNRHMLTMMVWVLSLSASFSFLTSFCRHASERGVLPSLVSAAPLFTNTHYIISHFCCYERKHVNLLERVFLLLRFSRCLLFCLDCLRLILRRWIHTSHCQKRYDYFSGVILYIKKIESIILALRCHAIK